VTGLESKASQLCDPGLAAGTAIIGGLLLSIGGPCQNCQRYFLSLFHFTFRDLFESKWDARNENLNEKEYNMLFLRRKKGQQVEEMGNRNLEMYRKAYAYREGMVCENGQLKKDKKKR